MDLFEIDIFDKYNFQVDAYKRDIIDGHGSTNIQAYCYIYDKQNQSFDIPNCESEQIIYKPHQIVLQYNNGLDLTRRQFNCFSSNDGFSLFQFRFVLSDFVKYLKFVDETEFNVDINELIHIETLNDINVFNVDLEFN